MSSPTTSEATTRTVRESVVPLAPKASPVALTAPSMPLEAIREAVRAEMAALSSAAGDHAARAAVAAVATAQSAATRGVIHALATLLAVRLMLMLALTGGFVLAVMALRVGTYQAGGVLVAYAVLILIPLIWLERNPRVEKPGAVETR